ncbi:MAG: hypothetical protein HOK97_08530 [Deltaproteobacteria bacterium]|jgi:hypothetical protein|nr:hypothetical protein [Deltaproteobacteria bacterium]
MNNKFCIEIAELGVCFTTAPELRETMNIRYRNFIRDRSPVTEVEIVEVEKLEPKFGESSFIPQIRYLNNGFEVDQAPYFFIEYNFDSQIGRINFTKAKRVWSGEGPFPEEDTPLAFGLRRSIGVLFITLLARESAATIHGAAVRIGDKVVIAPGDSDTGKSTFFSMFEEPLQLNDEFIVLREKTGSIEVFSTPFSETWDKNRKHRSGQLALVLNLIQSPAIKSRPIDASSIMKILVHNQVLPAEAYRECEQTFDILVLASVLAQGQDLLFSLDGPRVAKKVESLFHV